MGNSYNYKAMINFVKRIKYAHEDPRDMPAHRKHRTRPQGCL